MIKLNIEPILIILMGLVFILGYGSYAIINQDVSETFITKCNELHGKGYSDQGNWTVIRLSEYTTYSEEFWQKYPRIYISKDLLDGEVYSCFKI